MNHPSLTRRRLIKLASGAGISLGLGWRPLAAKSTDMIFKAIPDSDEALPAIGIGTNRYKVGNAEQTAGLKAALKTFAELGGQVVDTAPVYNTSETILGQLIDELGIRDDLFIATKVEKKDRESGITRMEESIVKLQTPVIDLMQSHQMNGAEKTLPAMREWQQEGRIRYVGITTSRSQQFADVLSWMRSTPLDFLQVNYSLADREAAKEILPLAAEKGIAVLITLPLGRGKLFKAVGDLPVPAWAAEFDAESWAQIFLKYVISHPAVTCAIPGMTQERHAADNLGAARGRLPDKQQRRQIEVYFDDLPV